MSKRLFIVGPTGYGQSLGDTLHHVCETKARGSYDDIYMEDKFTILTSVGSLQMAIKRAKKMGAKRPFVMA